MLLVPAPREIKPERILLVVWAKTDISADKSGRQAERQWSISGIKG